MISNPALADGARPKQAHTAARPARPERAIIMGASMAGLSAARILANYFDEVDVPKEVVCETAPIGYFIREPQKNEPSTLALGYSHSREACE
jgi:hypothetical protein